MILSIIIPVYNVEPFVEKCIRSCEAQDVSKDDYEIVVVNDGSKDNSLDVINRVANEFENIRVFTQSNQGLSKARNQGLSLAKGEYVWFVDSDDWIVENCIGRILDRIQETQPDMLQIQYEDVYDDNSLNEIPKFFSLDGVCTGKEVVRKGCFLAPAPFTIIRRKFMIDCNLSFYPDIYHEDSEFKPKATYLAERCASLDKVVYKYYRRTSGSITSQFKLKNGLDLLIVMNNLLDFSSTQVELPYRCYFYDKIGLNMNSLLKGYHSLPDKECKLLKDALKQQKHLFQVMRKSNLKKYQLEGAVFSVNIELGLFFHKLMKRL